MIRDRMNKLGEHVHVGPFIMPRMGYLDLDDNYHITTTTPHHDYLDKIDKHLGIITRFTIDRSLAPLGERVRRLERHIELKKEMRYPPMFWLGAEAEGVALTG